MRTSRHQPERIVRISNWIVEELENDKGYHFISPQGYIFGLASKRQVLEFIADLSFGGFIYTTMYGDSHEVRNGNIYAWRPDAWINPGVESGDHLAAVCHLTDVALTYVNDQWI